ncbi:uncharacterized protein LOC135825327 [Sycon ciliatum]|uniref:uncharacterized protein LOC135825327 n=1 Tax=Sycon ciliatum TaxID=27933 RepID=UPI0020ABD89A|eukprot:scpid19543/ scgid5472/ 
MTSDRMRYCSSVAAATGGGGGVHRRTGSKAILILSLISILASPSDVVATTASLPPKAVQAFVGDSLMLHCSLNFPGAVTLWQVKPSGMFHFYVDPPLDGGRVNFLRNGTLYFTDLELNDTGLLQCQLRNNSLLSFHTTNLTVSERSTSPPSMMPASIQSTIPLVSTLPPVQAAPDGIPRNVSIAVLDDTRINVSWTEAMVSLVVFRVTEYIVYVRKYHDVGSLARPYRAPGTSRSFVVEHLDPDTVYSVHVAAANSADEGASTEEEVIRTFEKGFVPTVFDPSRPQTTTLSNAVLTSTLAATTPPNSNTSEGSEGKLIFGLSALVFVGIIVGAFAVLLLFLLLAVCLYCKKSKKLKKERSHRQNGGSQVDMIRAASDMRSNASPWPTPAHYHGNGDPMLHVKSPAAGSGADLRGFSMPGSVNNVNYCSQYSSQQDVCNGNVFSPQRKRKMPRPGGVPPLQNNGGSEPPASNNQHHVTDAPVSMEMTTDIGGQGVYDPNLDDYPLAVQQQYHQQNNMYMGQMNAHAMAPVSGHGSNMSTLNRTQFQSDVGMIIPPPPARTPPPLQVGDYPQSFPGYEETLDDMSPCSRGNDGGGDGGLHPPVQDIALV